jgi:prepilin-type N-terminal cleavage/methylation domain-containing protein
MLNDQLSLRSLRLCGSGPVNFTATTQKLNEQQTKQVAGYRLRVTGEGRWGKSYSPITCNLQPTTYNLPLFTSAASLCKNNEYLLFIERQRRAAFTMVELLTVLAIMVIVAAISIPAFAALFADNNMVQAQNQLSTAVAGARTLAIQNHTDVALIFFEEPGHTGETAYAYEEASPGQSGAPATTTYFQPMPQESVQYLPKGVYVATLVGTSNSYGTFNSDSGFAMPPQQLPAISGGVATLYQPNNTTWANGSANQAAPLRAIVFNGNGHLTILTSMITQEPEQIDHPGTTTPITWWNGPPTSYVAHFGPSAPGFVAYEPANWPNPLPGGESLGTYLAANSDITMISTYTGNVIQ